MKKETKLRINYYQKILPSMKERIFAALILFVVAFVTAVSAAYAWLTISRAPVVQNIATSLSSNGALEIALSKEDGSQPEEFDIDESAGFEVDLVSSNLRWGNLVNLSDPSYGIDNLALRPAQLNDSALLTNPLWGASYGEDGRITVLNTDFAYARYEDGQFWTSNNTYGVRAIASYTATVSDATAAEQREKINAINYARTAVNQAYSEVPGKFSAMGTMISKYAQDKLDDTNTNLAPYIQNMIPLYTSMRTAMEKQMEAYVALANFQKYMYAQNTGASYEETTWEEIVANKAAYNAANTSSTSTNGTISLVGLTQFITDYNKLVADIGYLNQYNNDYKNNGTAYYWGSGGVSGHQLNNIVANLIDYNTMTIDLKGDGNEVAVTALSGDNASDLMAANGDERKVYTYNGIAIRFEQLAIDEAYRLNGNAACTIKVTKIITITVYGKAYTKASGKAYFALYCTNAIGNSNLAANDAIADDTYGMAIDFWVRTNAESTNLTLEGALTTDENGNYVSYDGINRIWGSTNQAVLTTDSTTQGGGSFYVYYADTPEDTARSLDLLEAMKVAFVDQAGNLLATASMDTVNYFAVNGRITVPLVIDSSSVSYTYHDELNQEITGKAITTLIMNVPQRIEAIIYLDGTRLENDNVLANAEIQGQLNIQFGSSTKLNTVGDNDLIDDTHYVEATVSKTEMDFDTAVTDEDLTTDILVNVSGANPQRMTAFFVRAINATQGTREETITFTKQSDGKWLSSYQFKSPGTYYLRYIRLDGVDYALHDPQKVEAKGFALRSVRWGEASDNVVVRTSDNTYQVPLFVEFASTDRDKMPAEVKAQFMRSDGNSLTVPLTFNAISGQWTGTAEFSTSETYSLKYLIFRMINDPRNSYKDLESIGINKVIELSLGLYVEVYNGSGAINEQFESGHTYSKDLTVRIFDNSGNELTELEGAKLYYSNGGSATNTINTNLTWNEAEGCYEGVLPIVRAGRYKFSSVQVLGSYLTKCTESPTYIIMSPDPPTFVNGSESSYFGGIQFAPFTYDAVIDNIEITNSESAEISAVVYNDKAEYFDDRGTKKTGKYFTVEMTNGDVYYNGRKWVVKLPTYTNDINSDNMPLDGAEYTQEGTWTLVMLSLTGCYDANGNLREEANPLVFAGSGAIIETYLSDAEITADVTCNFYPLTTTVSCTVKVSMFSGTTALGGSSTPFMTRFPVSTIGMYALLTDEAGNVIPENKVGDVTLSVSYAPNSNSNTYGYKVMSGAAKVYSIKLNDQDAETGRRAVSEVNGASDFDWQYVGEYNVTNLKVTLGGTTLTYSQSDNIGIPTRYTITTGGPSAENISLPDENITQRNTVLGKTGDTVTGTFMQSFDPGITAKPVITTSDNSNTQYVVLDDVTVDLVLSYQNGKTAPNGNYSWTGTSEYEELTKSLSNNSGTFTTTATPLLAGTYSAALKVTVGASSSTKTLNSISVYSKTPTVKIKSVTPGPTTDITMNPDITSESCYIWANVEEGLITVQNYKSDFVANVYADVTRMTPTDSEGTAITGADDIVDYTLPKVSLSVTNFGTSFDSATATIGNATSNGKTNQFKFLSGSSNTSDTEVGALGSGSLSIANGEEGCDSGSVTVSYEIYQPAGEQTFNTLAAVKGSTTYTINLTDTVTIREINTAPPRISFVESPAGYTTPEGKESDNGASFTFTLPSSIGQIQDTISIPLEGAEWVDSSTATQKICYVEYPNEPTLKESGSRGSCSSKYSYWIYTMTYTYHKFTKTTTTQTLTTGTNNYSIKKGVVKWIVGGVEYNPGQTITVSGVVTATPVIGEIAGTRTYLNSSTQTGQRDHIVIVSDGTTPVTITADSDNYSKNQNNTKAAVMNKEDANKPSGYEWGNSSNKKQAIETANYYTEEMWT